MECEAKDCQRTANTRKFGNLCLLHYKRASKTGTTDECTKRKDREASKCKFCDRKIGRHGAKGMCNKHYQMDRLHGNPLHIEEIRSKPGSSGYFRDTKGRQIHRGVVEDYIGRKLTDKEIVHHIDFIKTNNAIGNLYLCKNRSEHAKIHSEYNKLRKRVGAIAIIFFENGVYKTNSF